MNVLEPVSGRAHLVRAAGVTYSEVAGSSILCNSATRVVYAPSPLALTLWSKLDGRPLRAVADELGLSLDGPSGVELIELLRRLKANGLIEDQDPSGEPLTPSSLGEGSGHVDDLVFTAAVADTGEPGPDGRRAQVLTLHGDDAAPLTVQISLVESTAVLSSGGRPVVAARFDPSRSGVDFAEEQTLGPALDPATALSCWVLAIADSTTLEAPEVIDTLALVAESVPVTVIAPTSR